MIQLSAVSKAFRRQPVLRSLSLTLHGGRVALIGANGSGKTTLLRLLATLIRPDSGSIVFHGLDTPKQAHAVRRTIGYVPQSIDLPGNMTPRTLLRYLANIRRVNDPQRPDALLSALRLAPVADRPLGALSGGQVRLVCLAQALLAQPDILLLDEVFSGIGIEERQAAMRVLAFESSARLIVFSTNTTTDAQQLAARRLVLRDGRAGYEAYEGNT